MLRFFMKAILFIPYRIMFPVRFINKSEYRKLRKKHKAYIIVSNHRSNSDAPTMYLYLSGLRMIGKASLFRNKFVNWFFRTMGLFPVQKGKDIELIKHCLRVLKGGKPMLIYPEGIRAFTPEDALALRNGASMMAIKAGVPMIPMVKDRTPKLFRLTRIKVGEIISTEQYQGRKVDKAELTELSGSIADTMKQMLDGFEKHEKRPAWDLEPVGNVRAIVFRKNQLLVIKRVKQGETYYVLPGGHLDPGESTREAVTREVMEECGITVRPVRNLYKAMFNHMQSFYLCEYKHGEVTINPDTEEYTDGYSESLGRDGKPHGTFEPMWMDIDELKTLELKPAHVADQLWQDIEKYSTQLSRKTIFLQP